MNLNLTKREVEVLKMLSDGHTAPEIKESLFVALPTVKNHIRSIRLKMGQKTVAGAVGKALRGKIIE